MASPPSIFVDTEAGIVNLIKKIKGLPQGATSLFIELEGVDLSRHGSISILTIYVLPEARAYLVDVHKLKAASFVTADPAGTTLKSILESAAITKAFFDVRNASHALFAHYRIVLKGTEDVQVMENAARPSGYRYLIGLEKMIQSFAPITPAEKQTWCAVKDKGMRLFHPSKGGTYEVFHQRPLNSDVVSYCANNVQFLPGLRNTFWSGLSPSWKLRVVDATEARVRGSLAPRYNPQSEANKIGPWEFEDSDNVLLRAVDNMLPNDMDEMWWEHVDNMRLEDL
ncbi:exonuclease [Ilyonectria destructans]|nr:exonuclease [Ilyonectria destructans]